MTAAADLDDRPLPSPPPTPARYPRRSDLRRADLRRAQATAAPHRPRVVVGVARLLVIAVIVGVEGLAVTSFASGAVEVPATTGPQVPASAVDAVAVLAEADDRHRSALRAQLDAALIATAHEDSAGAKVKAALQQASAAAARVRAKAERERAAAERRRRALRDAQRNPRAVARILLADRGWSSGQFDCLDKLWTRESQWNYRATNPSSGAYGIPQALPGSKMATVADDWRTNPVTQIRWGLGYIAVRYGTPCGAWAHSESVGWY